MEDNFKLGDAVWVSYKGHKLKGKIIDVDEGCEKWKYHVDVNHPLLYQCVCGAHELSLMIKYKKKKRKKRKKR